MTTPTTGNAREGKYCPRCRTMTGRDREVCEHCGHRFRTGLGTGLTASPLDAPITDEAALHRTMQFTLPPLAPRPAAEAPEPPGAGREAGGPRLRGNAPFALALGLLGLALLGAWGYVRYAQTARAAPPSPVGVWETAPTGRPAQGARQPRPVPRGRGGAVSWAAAPPPPPPPGRGPPPPPPPHAPPRARACGSPSRAAGAGRSPGPPPAPPRSRPRCAGGWTRTAGWS